jgi:2-oxoglutarate ferredoxin oxidoreductase subunit alpha
MRSSRRYTPEWALSGAGDRPKRLISSLQLQPEALEIANRHLQAKLATIAAREVRASDYMLDDADLVVVGFGSAGRIAQSAVKAARQQGISAGLLRPLTLCPFPEWRISQLAGQARAFLVVELNAGQMLDDVRLAVAGHVPVRFYGRMGGMVPLPDEILEAIIRLDSELTHRDSMKGARR